jgi:hypothetical protein
VVRRPQEQQEQIDPKGRRDPEALKALLDAARADVDDEQERTRVLDGKLGQLAAFCGVSISITGAVGGSVVAAGRLSLGFTIALGAVLSTAALLLLAGVVLAFRGLAPKDFAGVSRNGARGRLKEERLALPASEGLPRLAATYVKVLERAREVNENKAQATTRAFVCVGLGFASLVLALLTAVVGSVTR